MDWHYIIIVSGSVLLKPLMYTKFDGFLAGCNDMLPFWFRQLCVDVLVCTGQYL